MKEKEKKGILLIIIGFALILLAIKLPAILPILQPLAP